MAGKVVRVTDANFEGFLGASKAVLVLGKNDCGNCLEYIQGIESLLEKGDYQGISFGKVVLNEPGAGRFKRENPWMSSIKYLPFTVLYREGTRVEGFAASNVTYLQEMIEDNLLR